MFDNSLLIQLTAYYKDISNQQNTTTYYPAQGSSYTLTTSDAYQDIRGFEITLRKSPSPWFSGFINYTYQTFSSGDFGTSSLYEDPAKQEEYDQNTVHAYQTRYKPSPYARANLNFSTPADFGPVVAGNNIFGDLMLNFIFNWQAGGWSTYNPLNAPGISNNLQYVDYFDGRLRVSKNVDVGKFSIQLFMDISNIFNTLRLRNAYDQDYLASLHLPKSNAYQNIPGDDKQGDYRKPGVEWQPMQFQKDMTQTLSNPGSPRAVYYEEKTGLYWQYTDNQSIPISERWTTVDQHRIDQINNDKAYIYMPNPSTYWFLYPRNFTYGLRVSFNFN